MNNTEYQNKIIYTNLLKKGILLLACSLPFVFMISAYSGTILWNRFFMILIILCVMYIIYSFYTFNTLNAQTVGMTARLKLPWIKQIFSTEADINPGF